MKKIDFPNHPHHGQVFHQWMWDGEKWISAQFSGWAPIYSPNFLGMPTAPTPEPGSNDAKIATTAFVMREIEHHIAGVSSFNHRTGHVELELQDIFEAGGAPLHSPHFTGEPEAETPPLNDDSRRLATTEFVQRGIDFIRDNSVWSFNQRTGNVELNITDITMAGGAPILDPYLQGIARSPSPPERDNSNRIATTFWVTEHVDREIRELERDLEDDIEDLRRNTVWTWNQRKGHVVMRWSDVSAVGGAPIESPHFLGKPRAPTPPPQDDSSRLATTRYVDAAIHSNPGPPGPQGPKGEMGVGFNFRGTVPTVAQLPAGASVGDVWITSNTDESWYWTGTHWISMGMLPPGPQGETGPPGPPGPTGPQGPPGEVVPPVIIANTFPPILVNEGYLTFGQTLSPYLMFLSTGSIWQQVNSLAQRLNYYPVGGDPIPNFFGRLIYHETQHSLAVFDGVLGWVNVGAAYVNDDFPSSPFDGQFYWDYYEKSLYLRDYDVWRPVLVSVDGYIDAPGVLNSSGISAIGIIDFFASPSMRIRNLPITAPVGSGYIWNDAGFLRIT